MITVNEIMIKDVITMSPSESVSDAALQMAESNIRHIPIIDDQYHVVGLISQRDVLRAGSLSISQDEPNKSPAISQVMTKEIMTTHPRDSLRAAGLTLQQHKYGCLPVIKDKKLVGIITDSDFVGVAINLIEEQDNFEESKEYGA
ncbi:MAG: CBS domain-containing protein [Gammaproteobacteria bacterium]|nr:CBS domain-containing protein [Gammaproteobacteria bacterium]